MMSFLRSRVRSFGYAFSGWWYVIRTQKNTWIHTSATVLVILLGLWFSLSIIEWAIIILAISIVWISEFINTALEAIVDLASPQNHPLAKVGKDVGAAAVLIGALSSAIIGVLIFLPHLIDLLKILNQPR